MERAWNEAKAGNAEMRCKVLSCYVGQSVSVSG